jgi:hypothetical protein
MTDFDTIELAAELDPKGSVEFFLKYAEIEAIVQHGERYEGRELWASAAVESFDIDAHSLWNTMHFGYTTKVLGFKGNVSIAFTPRRDTLEIRRTMQNIMIRAAIMFIEQHDWDIGITFQNGEKVVLIRRGDELTLNGLYDIWTLERLAWVKQPYQVRNIPIK